MIITFLSGGLGNQLFQYAIGRRMSIEKKQSLFLDVASFDADYLSRKYALSFLNINAKPVTGKYFRKLITPGTKLNKLAKSSFILQEMHETDFSFHQQALQTSRPITYYKGYWQTWKYFEDIRPTLLEEFRPREIPKYPEWINNENVVAVGVRRTDYLVDTKYGFIGLKYYERAFELMKKKLANPLFIIFSDDITWCKENFGNEHMIFFEDPEWSKDYLKVHLMSQCKHNIVSNSTFYWWGAWLNTNPGQIVVRPTRPFNEMRMLYQYHYPDNWQVVDND